MKSLKGLFNLTQACIVDGDFWVPNEIDQGLLNLDGRNSQKYLHQT